MKKIGIYGGAFNPIHNTHLEIARECVDQFKLDLLLFIPTGDPPHKEISDILASDRIQMICDSIANDTSFVLDTREIYRDGKSYSYLTLQELKAEHPDDELYFIMGSDSIDYFNEWKNPEIISSLATIIVAMRAGDSNDHITSLIDRYNHIFPGDFVKLNHIATGISSSGIRAIVSQDEGDITQYVPESVNTYIRQHKLYMTESHPYSSVLDYLEIVKKDLKRGRYIHTVGVAGTCGQLANRWGYPSIDAMIAGALHDCAKCISDEKRIEICNKNNIEITPIEYANPQLLHSKVGAFWAKSKFGIKDKDILHAIEVHTTGCPAMSLIDKILFVSDYIEPGRDKQPRLNELRRMAYIDLDMCVYMILYDTVNYLKENPKAIDQTTISTYEFYKDLIEKRGKDEQ